jgi:hypothetical protein
MPEEKDELIGIGNEFSVYFRDRSQVETDKSTLMPCPT